MRSAHRAGGSCHARAEEALENGDFDGAVDQQAQAMDALRQVSRR